MPIWTEEIEYKADDLGLTLRFRRPTLDERIAAETLQGELESEIARMAGVKDGEGPTAAMLYTAARLAGAHYIARQVGLICDQLASASNGDGPIPDFGAIARQSDLFVDHLFPIMRAVFFRAKRVDGGTNEGS